MVGKGKYVILTRGPFGYSLSKITAVSWTVDQSKLDSHFDSKIDPQFYAYIQFDRIYLQQKATQMLREEHSTRSLEDTYQAQMSGTHPKLASKCPGGGRGIEG